MIAWSNTMIKFVALPLLRKALAIRYSPIIVLYQTCYLSEKVIQDASVYAHRNQISSPKTTIK